MSPSSQSSPARRRSAPLAMRLGAVLAWCLAFGHAPEVLADTPDFDVRLHGVALDDFDSNLARALESHLREHPPDGLTSVHAVVLGPVPATTDDTPDACRPALWQFDVLGARGPVLPTPRRRNAKRTLHHPKPGSRGHVDVTDVVRVGLVLPAPDSACPFPANPQVEVLDRFPLAALNPFLHVSISDRVVLLEDPARDFRRIFPAGVGAIDHLRRPGRITSLTPSTDGSRLDPRTSFRTLGAPRWFANEPFLPIEAPMAVGDRIGFYTTRVAFHVFQTHRFMRAYVSRGCVTLRTGDLRELRDVLFARTLPIPLFIGAETMPDVYHPHPHEDGLHFVLKPFGPPERPTWRVSGNLYVTEKVLGAPPPGSALIGVPLDSEARLRQRMTLADDTRPNLLETVP